MKIDYRRHSNRVLCLLYIMFAVYDDEVHRAMRREIQIKGCLLGHVISVISARE